MHDHKHCITSALAQASAICEERGLRWTKLRAQVLSLVWQAHKPIGAYEVLRQLQPEGKPAAPPTVYRALDFLLEQGFVHRIASLNAFIGCICPDENHSGQFFICKNCKETVEIKNNNIRQAIKDIAQQQKFSVENELVEVVGTCFSCS